MKIKISFFLYKSKMNSKGLCPIRCRMTYNKKRKEFATGSFLAPSEWDSKKSFVKHNSKKTTIKNQLNIIRQKLNSAFLKLQLNSESFTVLDIYSNAFVGKDITEYAVIEVYNLHTDRMKKLIGKDIQQVTYDKYLESGTHVQNFIKYKFRTNDIPIRSLKSNFLNDFEYYLKTEKNFQQSTINKAIQRFRSMIKFAIAQDYLHKDPFMLFKYKTKKKDVVYLSKTELQNLENKEIKILRLEQVRDLFVFCCYTGLGFKEMRNLKPEQIIKEFDGNLWLQIKRNKTQRVYKVPLLPKAKSILKKYEREDSEYTFPRMHNQPFNAYLKELAGIVGITKNLTHHISRKTFATTILLYNDVPMEVVSELLGHSSMKTTQNHYGKIIQKKVGSVMSDLSKRL